VGTNQTNIFVAFQNELPLCPISQKEDQRILHPG